MAISRWTKSALIASACLFPSSAFACGYGCGYGYYDTPYAFGAPNAYAVIAIYPSYPVAAYYQAPAYHPSLTYYPSPAYEPQVIAVALPGPIGYAAPRVRRYTYDYGSPYGHGYAAAAAPGLWAYARPRVYHGPRRGMHVRAVNWRRW